MAAQRTQGNAQAPTAIALVIGVVMMVGMVGFFVFARGSDGADAPFPIIAVALGVGVLAAVIGAVVVLRR